MSVKKVAAIQMVSTNCLQDNLKQAQELIEECVKSDVKLVVLPENFAFMGATENEKVSVGEALGEGPIQDFLASISVDNGIWLIAGTVPIQTNQSEKVSASCLVYSPQGQRVARYDKIHLFDVGVSDEVYQESKCVEPGNKPIAVETPIGCIGLSVCYDVRFPELYRVLFAQGAEILTVPAAFTQITGRAHWEILLRARAIENQCYVIAPNQGGRHPGGRETYGHSMIIDPWGQILSQHEQGPGVVIAEFNPQEQAQVRAKFPVSLHRKIMRIEHV